MRFSKMFVYNYLLNVVILDIGYKIAIEVNKLSSPALTLQWVLPDLQTGILADQCWKF
jgi:hypothetical protein